MKLTILYRPNFRVEMTPNLLSGLLKCSSMHYDTLCSNYCQPGWPLFGAKNTLKFATEHVQQMADEAKAADPDAPDAVLPETVDWTFSFHELDVVSKIMEMATTCFHAKQISDIELGAIRMLQVLIGNAVRESNERVNTGHLDKVVEVV